MDAFIRFKNEYDNKLRKLGTSSMFDTSFLTHIKSPKLYGLRDEDIINLIDIIDDPKLDYLVLSNSNREYGKIIKKDELVEAVCEECENNIFFFIRILLYKFIERQSVYGITENMVNLNYGLVSLMYYYQNDKNCLLCNPRQTGQSTILDFLYYHAKYISTKYENIFSYSKIHSFRENEKIIDKIIPKSMMEVFKRNKKESENSNDIKPNCVVCDDFEFLDFRAIFDNSDILSKKTCFYGAGTINKFLDEGDIKFINEKTLMVYNDFEISRADPIMNSVDNISLNTGITIPINRILFNVEALLTDTEIEKLRISIGSKQLFQSEVLRLRPQEFKSRLLDTCMIYEKYEDKISFENESKENKISILLYKLFGIKEIATMDVDEISDYYYMAYKLLQNDDKYNLIFNQ